MKTIIFPSSGNPASLEMFRKVIDVFHEEEINCIFLELRALPDNYNDLVTISKKRTVATGFDPSFTDGLRNMHKTLSQKTVFSIDHVYGDSAAVFKNYVQHREADIVVFEGTQWNGVEYFNAKNVFRMVSRSGAEMIYLAGSSDANSITLASPAMKVNSGKTTRAMSMAGNINIDDAEAPETLKQQYQSVDTMLNDLESSMLGGKYITKRFGNLSRYFLREETLEKILADSEHEMLWVK